MSDHYELFGAPISPSRRLYEPEAGRSERPTLGGKSVTVHRVACFLERLGGNPSFFRDLAKGETAATEVQREKGLKVSQTLQKLDFLFPNTYLNFNAYFKIATLRNWSS